MRRLVAGGLVLWFIAAGLPASADTVVARWIQLGPGSTAPGSTAYGDLPSGLTPTILARAITSDGTCPALLLDGTAPVVMAKRVTGGQMTDLPGTSGYPNGAAGYPRDFVSNTQPGAFPDGTAMATTAWAECEAVVPPGHASASIGGVALKLPAANPQRILVIGDTGCRMAGSAQQDCHDPAGFPFARLANFAAQFKPDLIVHVGDYFYRDTSCIVPASGSRPAHEYVAGCNDPTKPAYETWGDTFDSWNADLLYPAGALLAAAPWVMTRGNHESCGRGARGWYALLDPHPFAMSAVTCAGGSGSAPVTEAPVYGGDFQPTFVVPAGAMNLLVHDSSFANDITVDANMARNYDLDLTRLLAALPASSTNIFVTHKPTFGLVRGAPTNAGDFTEQFAFGGNATQKSVFRDGVPDMIALFLSGHIHQFQYVNFQDHVRFPPQLIVGFSGDNLDATVNPDRSVPTYAYQSQPFTVHSTAAATASTAVADAFGLAEFGFAVLDATPTGFTADVYTVNADKAGRCTITLRPRNIACWQ